MEGGCLPHSTPPAVNQSSYGAGKKRQARAEPEPAAPTMTTFGSKGSLFPSKSKATETEKTGPGFTYSTSVSRVL